MNIQSLTTFFSVKELVLVGIIFFLLVLVFILLVYAVILRVFYNSMNRYYARKQSHWEKILLKYIDGTATGEDLSLFDLKFRDWIKFGEFIENYLMDLMGEDYDAIIQFLREVGLHEMLIKALDSSDWWERAYSAYFLGLMKYEPAEQKLLKLVYDKSSLVSINAFEALSKIGINKDLYRIIKFVLHNSFISISKVTDIILSYSTDIFPVLIKLLNAPDVTDRAKRIIIDVLASRNVVESLPVITKLVNDTSNTELIIGCIKAIGEFGDPESMDFLFEFISSPNWIIRSQALKAIGKVSSPIIIPELKMILSVDKNYWVKFYSAQVIMDFGENGKKELESMLEMDPEEDVANILNYVLYEIET